MTGEPEDLGAWFPEELNAQWRRRTEFAVAGSGLPWGVRLLLRAVLLRQGCAGEPCKAGWARLARDCGISRATFYRHLREARERDALLVRRSPGLAPRTVVAVRETEEVEALRLDLWRGEEHRTGLERLPEPEAELRERGRIEDWLSEHRIANPGDLRPLWARTIQEAPRPSATARATAWATELFLHRHGRLLRRLTEERLGLRSGLSRQAVRRALGELEAAGWLSVTRFPGRGGGIEPRLRFPRESLDLILRRDGRSWGETGE